MLVDCRFRVHAFLRTDVSQLGIGRWAIQLLRGRMSPRVIADEMQVIPV